ncbi:DNA binding protein Ncp1, putative [Cryptococcus deneoformans JEC21]|uniref:DNA binding protein Ncp1, putative n=1 Tax=Cryptococcus deneoformans (strain JEC21 / ATCC MYA-565) TaxID=214684 RepID=Q5KM77_CRYD1|nr:DNA binding protein Ncp1, putative [Cryptococcus neoformans var. neoformans JEC21]AAW41547.1 DNA binding protein Ncp1, putative [Cryptococcus neoformans var. neoformans JEC21]
MDRRSNRALDASAQRPSSITSATPQPVIPVTETNNMAIVPANSENDTLLANRAAGINLNERPASRTTRRSSRANGIKPGAGQGVWDLEDGETNGGKGASDYVEDGDRTSVNRGENGTNPGLESVLNADPKDFRDETYGDTERPAMNLRPSRSYVKPVPIVTTYEPQLPDGASAKRRSVAGSTRAPSYKRAPSRAASIDNEAAQKPMSPRREASKAGSVHSNTYAADMGPNGYDNQPPRPVSRTASARNRHFDQAGAAGVGAAAGGLAVGEFISQQRQQELQGGNSRHNSGVALQDGGPVPRATTFEEPSDNQQGAARTLSPRPQSSFGHRPQPQLLAINEGQGDYQPQDGRDSRAGVLGRNGTVMSRANTLGRNGNLSRGANGGTVGSRKGAFGRGAGASIGTQPEEVLGRDDIHTRAELSERILDDATLHRLSTMEKKDARRLTKIIKKEAKTEAQAVQASIKELERLCSLQKEAANAERKSQLRLTKWTTKEHKARMRFLKEKERYEKIEGELRNAENDFEERRDHAAGLTAQVAEKTQDLDDLRAQKAADDREREVKILALKNPAHS